jgi:hypothetical protein
MKAPSQSRCFERRAGVRSTNRRVDNKNKGKTYEKRREELAGLTTSDDLNHERKFFAGRFATIVV